MLLDSTLAILYRVLSTVPATACPVSFVYVSEPADLPVGGRLTKLWPLAGSFLMLPLLLCLRGFVQGYNR